MFPEEQDRFWIGLREAFAQTHPDAPFILERQFYVPWQKKTHTAIHRSTS